MQIELRQTVDRIDTGYGIMLVHRFTDPNLERINTYSNSYVMEFVSESRVRLYFDIFGSNSVTLLYDFNNDTFECDISDKVGIVKEKIFHVDDVDQIIDKIEELYIDAYKHKEPTDLQ